MDKKNIENIDSSNDENEETLENKSQEVESETVDTLTVKNKSLYEQLKKAKGFVRDDDGKWVKKPEPKEVKTKPESKSNDFGYAEKGYLKSSGIKTSEFDFVQSEMKASGEDLDTLLENDYFKARLEKHRALKTTSEATPTGRRSGSGAVDSVEYWEGKPIEDVPADMRIKVVNAKLAKAKNKGKFYNS